MKYYPMPTIQSTAQAIILANGDFPRRPIPKSILQYHQDKLVCCDGAANNLSNHHLTAQVIIGDGDSLSSENQIKYQDKFIKLSDQNTNDLTKAVLFCESQSLQSLIILGATGKREDHTIANIALLVNYLSIIGNVNMITDFGVFNAIQLLSSFESYSKQQVSLFSQSPTPITTTNLKYPLNQQNHIYWWQGSLGDEFTIEVNNALIIYRAFRE
ncbi:Thiamine pyrophosphokinase (ThiN) (PDB:1IG0) [Commensalibacter communis]|uniref:thiamine diphosphokinase n=1 Tax=Commensalibacter communis TaxID=2972786 RepID=UPI0022FF75F7|nr:thiamine diphosphokinase [Commensalibacter communis]CAI3951115.1 Thiamine pyrophosphokinase (ThiN) (PDB:1IG0) [Commensalibacter communis]CAI3953271.1 Thiamine pyrophosphokinase (ThiN) (PDB:1IG0) [Commensalibacter communis]